MLEKHTFTWPPSFSFGWDKGIDIRCHPKLVIDKKKNLEYYLNINVKRVFKYLVKLITSFSTPFG